METSAFIFGVRRDCNPFEKFLEVGFREEDSIGEMKVVLSNTVVTASSFLMMAMLSDTKFRYFLTVLTPVHAIIIVSNHDPNLLLSSA